MIEKNVKIIGQIAKKDATKFYPIILSEIISEEDQVRQDEFQTTTNQRPKKRLPVSIEALNRVYLEYLTWSQPPEGNE